MTRVFRFAIVAVLGGLPPDPGIAQDSTLTVAGRVSSARDGAHLEGVTVEVAALRLRTVTDALGIFRLAGVPSGAHEIVFRRLGLMPITRTLDVTAAGGIVDLGTFLMEDNPEMLEDVIVSADSLHVPRLAMARFYERQAMGRGSFADVEAIERWSPKEVTDVLRHMEGLRIDRNRNYGRPLPPETTEFGYPVGPSAGTDTRRWVISTRRSGRGECPPLIFLDGMNIGSTLEIDVNNFNPGDIAGVEVYASSIQMPAEFSQAGSQCGAILIWTK